ncbi:glycosyltransferase [Bacteroides cellulosilyticus]|uniref:glycosyltransferase n=1 Tax=Bacteroides cellulosilyticus TaxID=246787 RepID=UPI0032C09890
MNTIKVLEVIRQGHVGGGESHLLDLVMGFDTSIISSVVLSFAPGQMIDALKACGVKCYVIPTKKPFDIRVLSILKKLIHDENIQLIHAHGSRAASNVLLLAGLLHIPLVYTVHGWSFHQDQPWLIRKLRAVSEKIICSRSKAVICVSGSNKVSGEEEFGLKHAVVIENGISVQRFDPSLAFKDVRPEFGITSDDFIIGFIGRITLQKSPLVFVESIALAHVLDSRIKGLIVGEGDMDDEVVRYINERHLEDVIYKSSFRSDIPEVLASIDVFCLPSLWEGFSIALLEAMSMGKPLVVTPTDGTREVIKDRYNGLIVDYNNPNDLAKRYYELLHDELLRKRLGNAARLLVENRFDSRRVSKEVIDIYKAI